MVKRSHGFYSGHARNLRSKGLVAITKQLREFTPGTKLRIDVDPRKPRAGIPLSFNRHVVTVIAKRGRGYEVELMDGGKPKRLTLHVSHLEVLS